MDRRTLWLAGALVLIFSAGAFAQTRETSGRGQGATAAAGRGGRGDALRASTAPLAFKVDWVRPANQTGQTAMVQENVADPNVEVNWYGPGARKLLTTGNPGSQTTPFGVWSGECEAPFVITFRHKTNNIDLSGLSRIRWATKTSGFHVVRPVVKLTNGTMLVADYSEMHVPMVTQTEFTLAGLRWLRLDPERVVTIAPGDANAAGTVLAPNETWVVNPDLSKVEEFGFADLMPASGHGVGGYIQLNNIEVYGKPVPRS
jgi:hypothetical protein